MMMITSKWVSQSIHAAAKLGIADLLKNGSLTSEELARATGSNADALYRVLRALSSVGVFREAAARKFELTPMADLLRKDVAGTLRPVALMTGDPLEYAPWSEVMYSIKSGLPAFDKVYNMGAFDYLMSHPEPAAMFNDAMTSYSEMETPAIIKNYDFSSVRVLMDVAGGHGRLLTSILAANKSTRGVLFDLAPVVAGAPPLITKSGVADRCSVAAGSFFEEIPSGADAIIMKHIIHDWSDERSIAILKNCRRALQKNDKVLLCEMVVSAGNDPSPAKWLDLQMLVMTQGGRERTKEEFAALFDKSGMRLERIVPTSEPICIIEGICV